MSGESKSGVILKPSGRENFQKVVLLEKIVFCRCVLSCQVGIVATPNLLGFLGEMMGNIPLLKVLGRKKVHMARFLKQ